MREYTVNIHYLSSIKTVRAQSHFNITTGCGINIVGPDGIPHVYNVISADHETKTLDVKPLPTFAMITEDSLYVNK